MPPSAARRAVLRCIPAYLLTKYQASRILLVPDPLFGAILRCTRFNRCSAPMYPSGACIRHSKQSPRNLSNHQGPRGKEGGAKEGGLLASPAGVPPVDLCVGKVELRVRLLELLQHFCLALLIASGQPPLFLLLIVHHLFHSRARFGVQV